MGAGGVLLLPAGELGAQRGQRGGSRPAAPDNAPQGTLASDEALAALRDKLSGQS